MINNALVSLLESILGKGKFTSRGNYAFMCPNNCHSSKPKLEVCLDSTEVNTKGQATFQNYACWICGGENGGFKGKKIKNLLKKAGASPDKLEELYYIVGDDKITSPPPNPKQNIIPKLPKEFISLSTPKLSREGKHAFNYLINDRNFTLYDIKKYNIGYCEEGKYSHRIIIPSYDEKGNLNYFISRTYIPGEPRKYDFPALSRDIIFFELFINWDLPIILCEGVFDAITLKRNAIPLLGTNITHTLMKKLVESKVNKIYLTLDEDALKKSIKHCENLMNEGKKVYYVNLKDKDPNKIGFNGMLEILYKTQPLTFKDLLSLKFEI